MRDLDLANRLRRAGLPVVECDGWQQRGKDANFRGGVDHHTAGSNRGNAPSLSICINGRAGLPGPLCNVLQGFDGTNYIVASGRANHAGTGGWRGLSGNSSVYGFERENDGHSPPRRGQHDMAAQAWAAIIRGGPAGNIDPGLICGHREWTSRKPDFHDLNYHLFRNQIAENAGAPVRPPIPMPPGPGTPTPPANPVPGAITMFIAIDSVALCCLMGNVLFTFPNLQQYGNSKNASPGVPAIVIGNDVPLNDRQWLHTQLIHQSIVAVGQGDELPDSNVLGLSLSLGLFLGLLLGSGHADLSTDVRRHRTSQDAADAVQQVASLSGNRWGT